MRSWWRTTEPSTALMAELTNAAGGCLLACWPDSMDTAASGRCQQSPKTEPHDAFGEACGRANVDKPSRRIACVVPVADESVWKKKLLACEDC